MAQPNRTIYQKSYLACDTLFYRNGAVQLVKIEKEDQSYKFKEKLFASHAKGLFCVQPNFQ